MNDLALIDRLVDRCLQPRSDPFGPALELAGDVQITPHT